MGMFILKNRAHQPLTKTAMLNVAFCPPATGSPTRGLDTLRVVCDCHIQPASLNVEAFLRRIGEWKIICLFGKESRAMAGLALAHVGLLFFYYSLII